MFHCSVINVRFALIINALCILSHRFHLVKNFLIFSFLRSFKLSCLVRCNFCILSDLFLFVKNFLNFFIFFSQDILSYSALFKQLWHTNMSFFVCQPLFQKLFNLTSVENHTNISTHMKCQGHKSLTSTGERGIWTLARRKPSTPLAGAPLQPLEYFSAFIKCL